MFRSNKQLSSLLAPLNISQSLSDISVLLGQSGTLQIVCDAFPAPKITWSVPPYYLLSFYLISLNDRLTGSSTMSNSRTRQNTRSKSNKTSFPSLSTNVIIQMSVPIMSMSTTVSIRLIKLPNSVLEVPNLFSSRSILSLILCILFSETKSGSTETSQ